MSRETFAFLGTMLTSVQLTGNAKAAADKAGVKSTSVSISHSDRQVIAVAISTF